MELAPSLTEENKYHLREGQKKMTRMLGEFHALCKKYKLEYWVIGGTFVGTVMYNGWLPWDGDMDIAMIDTDFEVFKQHAEELSPTTWLQTRDTDIHYKSPIHKLRDLTSHYIGWDHLKWHNGLQIDIITFKKDTIVKPTWYPHKHYVKGDNIVDYAYDTIFPLKETAFEDILVYMPNNPDQMIKQCYEELYVPPLKNRRPHEGQMISDRPHPDDIVRYKHLYEARGIKTCHS